MKKLLALLLLIMPGIGLLAQTEYSGGTVVSNETFNFPGTTLVATDPDAVLFYAGFSFGCVVGGTALIFRITRQLPKDEPMI
jgi:hypothetical protein